KRLAIEVLQGSGVLAKYFEVGYGIRHWHSLLWMVRRRDAAPFRRIFSLRPREGVKPSRPGTGGGPRRPRGCARKLTDSPLSQAAPRPGPPRRRARLTPVGAVDP